MPVEEALGVLGLSLEFGCRGQGGLFHPALERAWVVVEDREDACVRNGGGGGQPLAQMGEEPRALGGVLQVQGGQLEDLGSAARLFQVLRSEERRVREE